MQIRIVKELSDSFPRSHKLCDRIPSAPRVSLTRLQNKAVCPRQSSRPPLRFAALQTGLPDLLPALGYFTVWIVLITEISRCLGILLWIESDEGTHFTVEIDHLLARLLGHE